MSLATIRTALASRLTTANTALRFYSSVPDNPTPPCAFAGLAEGRYKDDFDGDLSFRLPLHVIVSTSGGSPRAHEAIEEYIEKTGTKSVYAAILADGDLGGTCHAAVVTEFFEGFPDPFDYLNAAYLGVTFTIEVMA